MILGAITIIHKKNRQISDLAVFLFIREVVL